MITNIKELRTITGLTQTEFGKKYSIPLKTIQNWEASNNKTESRSCPSYVKTLLAKAVMQDYPDAILEDKIDYLISKNKINVFSSHEKSLRYAIEQIKESKVCGYVEDLILYGSVARGEAKESSDIDLLLVLNQDIKKQKDYESWITYLKGNISSSNYDEPENDLHIAYGDFWKHSDSTYQKNIQSEGIGVWN